ncbi:hypothetical protein BS78_03G240900 [Paspalum vaginatum]|nr:hypothetical protein BS78_03G240900 [Paspalum vaginatum]
MGFLQRGVWSVGRHPLPALLREDFNLWVINQKPYAFAATSLLLRSGGSRRIRRRLCAGKKILKSFEAQEVVSMWPVRKPICDGTHAWQLGFTRWLLSDWQK